MNGLNQIILEGEVADVREMKNYLSIIISAERTYKNQDDEEITETSNFEIECWGNLAKYSEPKIIIGRGIRIVGRLKQKIWKEENNEYSKVVIVAEHIEFRLVKN